MCEDVPHSLIDSIARAISRKLRRPHPLAREDDIYSEALLQATLAARAFNSDPRGSASGFIYQRTEQRVIDHLRMLFGRTHADGSKSYKVNAHSFGDFVCEDETYQDAADRLCHVESNVRSVETRHDTEVFLRSLSPRNRKILKDKLSGKTQREIADDLGLTEARISQIIRKNIAQTYKKIMETTTAQDTTAQEIARSLGIDARAVGQAGRFNKVSRRKVAGEWYYDPEECRAYFGEDEGETEEPYVDVGGDGIELDVEENTYDKPLEMNLVQPTVDVSLEQLAELLGVHMSLIEVSVINGMNVNGFDVHLWAIRDSACFIKRFEVPRTTYQSLVQTRAIETPPQEVPTTSLFKFNDQEPTEEGGFENALRAERDAVKREIKRQQDRLKHLSALIELYP